MSCKTVTFRKDRKGRTYSTPRRVELCDSPRGKRRTASRTKSTQVSCRDGSTGRFASCDTPRPSRDEVRERRQRRGSRAEKSWKKIFEEMETVAERENITKRAWKRRKAARRDKRCPRGEVWVRKHARIVDGHRYKVHGYCRKA